MWQKLPSFDKYFSFYFALKFPQFWNNIRNCKCLIVSFNFRTFISGWCILIKLDFCKGYIFSVLLYWSIWCPFRYWAIMGMNIFKPKGNTHFMSSCCQVCLFLEGESQQKGTDLAGKIWIWCLSKFPPLSLYIFPNFVF